MVAKHLAVALLGSALIAAPALAQTSSGSGSTTSPSTGAAPTMNSNTGSSASGSSSMGSSGAMTQMQPGQWRASKLEGLDVYNNNNEKIGDISEMLVDQSGKIQAVVVGVGGFLGIGERDVAIPFEQVKFMNEPRSNAAASNTTTGTTGAGGTASGTATTAPSTTGSTAGTTTGTTSSANADDGDRSAPDHAVVNMTKDQLQGMPEFKMSR